MIRALSIVQRGFFFNKTLVRSSRSHQRASRVTPELCSMPTIKTCANIREKTISTTSEYLGCWPDGRKSSGRQKRSLRSGKYVLDTSVRSRLPALTSIAGNSRVTYRIFGNKLRLPARPKYREYKWIHLWSKPLIEVNLLSKSVSRGFALSFCRLL